MMSIANSLRAIAYSESSTLSGAIALIAKHRNDLEAAMRARAGQVMPLAGEGAATERALRAIEASVSMHKVDKQA